MKKILIFLFAINLFSGFLTAQDTGTGNSKQPKYLLGGALNFQKHKLEDVYLGDNWYSDDYKGFTLSLEGKFGVAVGKHVYLGLVAGYTHHEDGFYTYYQPYYGDPGYYVTTPVTLNILNFAPFLRFHNKLKGKLGYYADFYAGYQFSSEPNDYYVYSFKKLYTEMNIGANLMLSEKIGLEMMILSINYSEQEEDQYEEKLKILKTEFIFSNPTMGLVFYF